MRHLILLAAMSTAGVANADDCTIDLKGDDLMKFDKAVVTVSSKCPTITINLEHVGQLPINVMGHNVVIATSDVYAAVAQDGMTAGIDASYVKPGDARVVAFTKVVGGGGRTSATFDGAKLVAGAKYTFFCSFPGHYAVMKGDLVVQ